MSYSGVQNYNHYYHNQSSNHSHDSVYGNNRQAASAPNLQQASSTAHQYGSGNYNWPSQAQQTYGNLNQENQNYGGQSWKSGQPQQPAYNYAGENNNYGSSVSGGNTASYYSTTSQAPLPAGTNALNSLAYASGLESTSIQNQNSIDRTSQSTTPISATFHRNSRVSQERVSSPAQAQKVYHNYSRSSASNTYTNKRPQSSQQNLAASATAALTGATKRQQGQQRQSVNNYQQPPATYTPTMGSSVSTANATNSTATQNRSASPYTSRSSNSQSTPNQSALLQTSSAQYGNQTSGPYGNQAGKESHQNAGNNPRSRSQGISSSYQTQANGIETSSSVRSNNFNAVNNAPLSTSNVREGESSTNSYPQADTPATGMPDFIDPSKVYNPYHQEYARRKKEAADKEALLRQKTQEVEARQTITERSDARSLPESIPAAGSRRVKESPRNRDGSTRKPREKKSRQSEPIPKPGTSNSIARQSLAPQISQKSVDSVQDGGDDEAEMMAMLEKVRKLKEKDPSMFQRLLATVNDGDGISEGALAESPQPKRASLPPHTKPKPKAVPPRKSMSNQFPDIRREPVHADAKTSAVSPPAANVVNPNKIGGKVFLENNEENLPDLGRFPAERRQRRPNQKKGLQPPIADPSPLSQPSRIPSEPLQFSTTTTNLSQAQHSPAADAPAKLQSKETNAVFNSAKATKPGNPGSTIWPEAKRKSLAETAVKVLNAHPGNQSKQLSPEVILTLLDLNPSYTQLCEYLESKGLYLHRGHFARSLLNNVPDLAPPNQSQSQPQRTQSQAQIRSPASPTQANTGTPVSVKTVVQGATVKQESKTTNKPGPKPKSRLGVPAPPVPKPVPGSKEAQARKRNFSELVDLDLLSDDENYVMPSKKAKTETPPPSTEEMQPGFAVNGAPTTQADVAPSDPFAPLQFSTSVQPNSNYPPKITAQQYNSSLPPDKAFAVERRNVGVGVRTQPPLPIMAKAIDRKEALKKPFYDSKTIARDILIAAGRHPTEKGLNSHLLALAHRLDLPWDCDFNTIDWDSVDPGGPPVPRVDVEDILAGPPKWALGRRAHFSGREIQSDTDGSRQPIRKERAPHPATGRDGQNASKSLQDSLDPTTTQDAERSHTPQHPPDHSRALPHERGSSHPSSPHHTPRGMEKPGVVYPGGKRRGRPPGVKNKHPSIATLRAQAKAAAPFQVELQARAPSPVKTHVYQCAIRACGSELHNLATLRKHIRKQHLTGDEQRGYECWWRKCRTFDRKQEGRVVHTVLFPTADAWYQHVEEDHIEPLAMKYGDGPSALYSGKQDPKHSLDLSQFLFSPPTLKVSSGPQARTRLTDPQTVQANATRYLNNSSDEVVTYTSSPKTVKDYASDPLVLPVEKDPHKSFEKVHGNKDLNDVKSATDIFKAMEARKAKIPGIERGGCILVTPERRKTLAQDDDFEGIYMDSDDD